MKIKKIFNIISIFIATLVVIFIIGFVCFLVQDYRAEDNLKRELQEINKMVNEKNINIEEVNERLNRTISKGDYAIVEKAFKQYLSDFFKNIFETTEILNDEKLANIFTIENYKTDGPNFEKTKKYISETIKKLKDCKQKYQDFLTDEMIMSYIKDKNLHSYYVDFYKNKFVGNIDETKKDKTYENAINNVLQVLDNSTNIINFLSENKGKWKLEEDGIWFNNEKLSSEYKKLTDKITEQTDYTINKDFGSYSIPESWTEVKDKLSSNKYFYVLKGQENNKKTNNISINAGKNNYAKADHEKFKNSILNQLSMQVAGKEGIKINANGSTTDNGEILYTFIIKDEKNNTTTTQYYIVEDYKYILIHETTFGGSKETDDTARYIVNSFRWKR